MNAIRDVLGPKGAIFEPDDMARYMDDLQGVVSATPHAILRPANTGEVQAALRWCAREGRSVVPQGGLTGLTGAAVPEGIENAIILSLERMNSIREIDVAGSTMCVDAGTVLGDIRKTAEDHGRYFPLFHGAVGSSQIGGNLSTNSGGNNALRYGTAREQVLGLEVVLPDGTLWNGLRALRKNTAGYDLQQMFIGAEGTLGVITAAMLKLRPYPNNRVTAFIAIKSPDDALALLRQLEPHLGETIAAFELLSDAALGYALQANGARYPLDERSPWAILLEAETSAIGFDLATALETGLGDAIEAGLVQDAAIAQNSSQRDALWFLRESIASIMLEDKSGLKSDTAVPVSRVPAFIENAGRAVTARLPEAVIAPFGHLGDGNVHFNVMRPSGMAPDTFRALWHDLEGIIADETLALGGTISAEHGIGRLKRHSLQAHIDPVQMDLMRRVKNTLDPDWKMNPDVLFTK